MRKIGHFRRVVDGLTVARNHDVCVRVMLVFGNIVDFNVIGNFIGLTSGEQSWYAM